MPPQSITLRTTALYIIACSCTITTIFTSNFTTIPHRRCALLRFTYKVIKMLLLNVTMRLKYEKAAVVSSGSRLTRIDTLISPKQCCNVSHLRYCSSPRRHCYVVQGRFLRSQEGTWLPQSSQWVKLEGCSSSIIRMSLQCCRLKWFLRPIHVRDEPGHPGKDYWHLVVTLGNMTLNTWGRCSVLLTSSRYQFIDSSVPCRRLWWDVIEPAVNSNPNYRHSSRHRSLYQ